MGAIKISTKVDEAVWAELKAFAEEGHQSISGLLTEALREFLSRRRIRPEVLRHLDHSIEQNRDLGQLLAK